MKALQYTKPHDARIVDVDIPDMMMDQVLGKNIISNVSAGTEMAFYCGTAPQINSVMQENGLWVHLENNLTYPMNSSDVGCWWMGYASVVKIIDIGRKFTGDLKVGDVVFTPQGHKEYHVIKEDFQKIPEGISYNCASFKTLMEIAYNGFLDAKIQLLDDVVIFGMGTIGQLLVRICKLAGARVAVVDFLDSRLELAKSAGADFTVNPSKVDDVAENMLDLFSGKPDSVIEVSGNSKALNEAVRCVKNDGQITVLSFYQQPPINFMMGREFHHNRIIVRSSQIGGVSPELTYKFAQGERSDKTMNLLTKIDVTPLISHNCSFNEYPELINTINDDPSETLAVLIEYV